CGPRPARPPTRGLPAPVPFLYPFVPPGQIPPAVLGKAAAAVASVQSFDCQFAATGWFGDQVVWLAPEPDSPFRALTAAVHAAFPQCPPFGGAFAEVIPHLTIGDRPEGGPGVLRAAAAEVLPAPPGRTHGSRARLMAGRQAPGSCAPPSRSGYNSRRQRRTLTPGAEMPLISSITRPCHSVPRQQLPDLFHELLARRDVRHIEVDPGVKGLGDALPPVQCDL